MPNVSPGFNIVYGIVSIFIGGLILTTMLLLLLGLIYRLAKFIITKLWTKIKS